VDLSDYHNWWAYVPGASWKHPEGPGSTLNGRNKHPVTQVAYEDAEAYAHWSGKELPTEAEWEVAARGGLEGAVFAWGNEFAPKGRMMANTWQGQFPWHLNLDGFEAPHRWGRSPNGYGLYDIGNVWQWTCDFFLCATGRRVSSINVPHNRVMAPEQGVTAGQPGRAFGG
jgi:formylglycine-generating enzyme required for sulfatase activity